MANVVLDPKVHPAAIFPDLSKIDPLVKFTPSRVGCQLHPARCAGVEHDALEAVQTDGLRTRCFGGVDLRHVGALAAAARRKR
jgi:hypothetical protein